MARKLAPLVCAAVTGQRINRGAGSVVARPSQPVLSRQRIVEVATAILDAEGLDALSTRRLANELGVRAPSLYNHFATKEEILDAVGDAIIAQVDLSMFSGRSGSAASDAARRPGPAAGQSGSRDWAAALTEWARAYRRALAAHPHAVPFLASGPARRPAALALADAVYGALVDAGWPAGYATRIGATMRYFVAGSALGSFALGFADDPRVYAERYPHLHDAHRLREHHRQVDDGAFELGLATLVNGFVALFGQVVKK
jgi:AcrR family transcriptional regulator